MEILFWTSVGFFAVAFIVWLYYLLRMVTANDYKVRNTYNNKMMVWIVVVLVMNAFIQICNLLMNT